MARRYNRDNRGRFASIGATARGGRLKTASGGKRQTQTMRTAAVKPSGRIEKGGRRLATPAPGNNIRPLGLRSARQAPMGLKANAVRAFNPTTPKLRIGQLERQSKRSIQELDKAMKAMSDALKAKKPKIDKIGRKLERMNAQAIERRLSSNKTDRFLAGIELGIVGGRSGAKAIQRRMQRAADAAARGSQPAARARVIYANQLAFMGAGKPKAAKNNLRPGPRNTQGKPKRKRKRR